MQNEAAQLSDEGIAERINNFIEHIELISAEKAEGLDRNVRSRIAKLTKGMSPIQLVLAYADWLGHLSISPGKQFRLWQSLMHKLLQMGVLNTKAVSKCIADSLVHLSRGGRLVDLWKNIPFETFSQSHSLVKDWWREAGTDVDGVSAYHLDFVNFMNEQILEALSPENLPLTNRDVIQKTITDKGLNLVRGLGKFTQDMGLGKASKSVQEESDFQVGKDIAISPGKVIFQNDLMELIQYSPSTDKVSAEPVLIIPPWIMKYYILDLSPKKSMVKYLVDQGKTVFMVSWKNPQQEDRDVTMNDYLKQGFLPAMQAVQAVVPKTPINAVGYCIGGTLLVMAAAYLAREGDKSLNSVTLLAAQADFTLAGEIKRFLSDSQLSFITALMRKNGFLASESMGGSFAALRPAQLIWQPARQRYFLDEDVFMNDLMSWNADGTRMPYRMHSEYLQKMYLDNDLAEGRYEVDGKPIFVSDINVPLFIVGTETDHVAPWKSVYKLHSLTNVEIAFLLTSGGHNAGIISGPSHPRRKYRIHTRQIGDLQMDPDTWLEQTPHQQGSWWPVWYEWLDNHSSKQRKPPSIGATRKGYKPLRDAPGQYVFG